MQAFSSSALLPHNATARPRPDISFRSSVFISFAEGLFAPNTRCGACVGEMLPSAFCVKRPE